MAAQHHVHPTASRYVLAAYALRSLISGTPCCMLHFGIEWESVWYPNILGRKFGEEIGAACGVTPAKLVPAGFRRGAGIQNFSYSLDSGSRPLRGPRPDRGRNDVGISATNFRNGSSGLSVGKDPNLRNESRSRS
ncbi:protein of unknown function [Candidatus Methylomirabilis oxygeniifera]|uniref:Uncharacterized protein n=1 Tax=Methylomirabilis oxygeniifera TaxID=671143 RepID=D5MLD3_METO1|nr:protein of unknown function [Candidatus Methylomirabilis oxyfera]